MELVFGATNLNAIKKTDSVTELAIIDRCRRQEFEAFGRFTDLYQNRVMGFVRRMVTNYDEAADITQEVFIKAYQNFPRFDSRASVKTWLFRIAYNLCVDRSRKTARQPKHVTLSASEDSEDSWDLPDQTWEPDRLMLDSELMDVMEKAIGDLSEKLRAVLLLHDREDASYEEISDALGIPVGTVKSRLFLARNQLQVALKNYLNGAKI